MNINLEQQTLEMCLKQISNIGSTTYQNICTGELSVVMWGTTDWAIITTSTLFVIMLSLFFLAIMLIFLKDMLSWR